MGGIHSTAIVDPQARLAADVQVGPYTIIGPQVEIGAGTTIGPHCVIEGHTSIGENNRIWQFCSFNCGTAQDSGNTTVGDDNWVMAYVHLAHDVQLGSHCILANNATLAGHVHVGDWVIIGGLTGVHQFVKIGAHAMAGFQTALSQDVPPFMMVDGNPAATRGFNVEGLRRRGFGPERIAQVKQMHRLLYRQGLTLDQAKAEIGALRGAVEGGDVDVELMAAFLDASKRGIVR
jgi:UDP-N-acetylglucosamine acyltransferase